MMRERVVYYEYLRVLACFAVVLLHVAANDWRNVGVDSAEWLAFNFYDSISRWGVPIFVMISGALFIPREIPIKKIYNKYVKRLVILFFAWSTIYALVENGGVKKIICSIADGQVHLWFLPMIAGLYIINPFCRLICKDRKLMEYFLILAFAFTFLVPTITRVVIYFGTTSMNTFYNSCLNTFNDVRMHFVGGYVGYYVLGYYLSTIELNRKQRMLSYILSLVGFFATFLLTQIASIKTGSQVSFYGELSINVLLSSIGIFIWMKYNCPKSEQLAMIVEKISKNTLGIYLVHAMVIRHFKRYIGFYSLGLMKNQWIAVPVVAIAVFATSLVFTASYGFIKKYAIRLFVARKSTHVHLET